MHNSDRCQMALNKGQSEAVRVRFEQFSPSCNEQHTVVKSCFGHHQSIIQVFRWDGIFLNKPFCDYVSYAVIRWPQPRVKKPPNRNLGQCGFCTLPLPILSSIIHEVIQLLDHH